jgi:YebC/PmpR family DNA-binding regulatory protein
MAGHSKWTNIKHKKASTDAKRGKVWTRIIREIVVSTQIGGDNASSNPRLRLAIERASSVNMPKDNVARAIQRGTSSLYSGNYEETRYEGYGINGVAIIVDCMTDNKVRTVAEVRHTFSKFGGNMGMEGSVAFMFKHWGQIFFAQDTNEENLTEAALNVGAEDILTNHGDKIEIICSPNDLIRVKDNLEILGFIADTACHVMKPTAEVPLSGDSAVKQKKLLDALENLDDVQEVYSNAVIED